MFIVEDTYIFISICSSFWVLLQCKGQSLYKLIMKIILWYTEDMFFLIWSYKQTYITWWPTIIIKLIIFDNNSQKNNNTKINWSKPRLWWHSTIYLEIISFFIIWLNHRVFVLRLLYKIDLAVGNTNQVIC
jgi:hypothetical protein